MSDKEYSASMRIGLPMIVSFILFPAFCFITILFGYVWNGFIIMESIVGALILWCFILRTRVVFKCPHYASRKRLIFETTMYISCLIFAIATGFLVKENNDVFSCYFLNKNIQPANMIFVFVIMGLHISTDKKVAKAFNKENELRENMQG